MKNTIIAIISSVIMFNCAPPEPIIIEVPVEKDDKLTLGKVQSQIKKGMNQTEVLEVLGSCLRGCGSYLLPLRQTIHGVGFYEGLQYRRVFGLANSFASVVP